jgi:moderate conductance mechanosensitive channel
MACRLAMSCLLAAWLMAGGPALALPGTALLAPAEAPATAPATVPEEARALADLLGDEQARAALIARLLELAEDGSAAAAAADPAASDTAVAAPLIERGLARQVAAYTRSLAESSSDLIDDVYVWVLNLEAGLRASNSFHFRQFGEAALALAGIIAGTLLIYHGLAALARAMFARLAAWARDAGLIKIACLLGVSSVIDAIVILLAWAGGYVLALHLFGEAGRMDLRQTMFLNAFLLVEIIKVGLRSFLAPRYGALRLVPLSDLLANYWYFWLSRITGLLGYGMLLAVPIVEANLPLRIGEAVEYGVALTALVMAIVVVLQNRQALRAALEARARTAADEVTARLMAVVARLWHLLAIGYCLTVFGIWLLRPEGALAFLVRATVESLLVMLAGAVIAATITRAITGGLRLPEDVKLRLPLLESRLNALVPAVLKVVRWLVLLGVLLTILQLWSMVDVVGWLAAGGGQEIIARVIGVGLITGTALLIWLGISSWVDYRLNPNYGKQPGPRERTLLALFRSASTAVLASVALMLALSEIGVNIAPLLAGAGVLGLAVGFGAQKLVQDIITGIFIQFENAINEGEVVTAGGITGVVERLSIRSLGLRDLQGVYHIVPFSSVDAVANFMRGFAYHVAEIGIAYRENIDEAKAVMHAAFDELCQDPELGPSILAPLDWHGLTAFGDSAVVLRCRIKTRPGQQWATGRAYNAIIKRRFDEAGIEIPFPHMTLYFGQDKQGAAPPLRAAFEPQALARAVESQSAAA